MSGLASATARRGVGFDRLVMSTPSSEQILKMINPWNEMNQTKPKAFIMSHDNRQTSPSLQTTPTGTTVSSKPSSLAHPEDDFLLPDDILGIREEQAIYGACWEMMTRRRR